MNKFLAASLLALCHIGTASAAPDWCKGATFDDRYDLKNLSSDDLGTTLATFAKATCKPNGEARAAAAQIQQARLAWGKKLHMQEADWAEAVAYANVGERPDEATRTTKDLATYNAVDQYWTVATSKYAQSTYLADMFEPNLTEAGRLAYIYNCIQTSFVTSFPVVVWATCQGDIDAFDRAKFGAQISAATASKPEHRLQIRIYGYNLTGHLKEHKARVDKVFATDAAYKKLWEAAAKGRAEFATRLGGNKELLALARQLDGAQMLQSRKMFEGCEGPTQEALDKIIREKVPASLFADIEKDIPKAADYTKRDTDRYSVGFAVGQKLVDTVPEIAFIAGPYKQCHKESATATFLSGAIYNEPGFRGPRRAAHSAITKEKIVLDDLQASITYPNAQLPFNERVDGSQSAGGAVKSVKVDGDSLVVELERLLVKRNRCVATTGSNKIDRINGDGSISYQRDCTRMETQMIDETPSDFRIEKQYQPLLKKGAVFSAVGSGKGPQALFVVWPSKTAKLPSHVFGQAVK